LFTRAPIAEIEEKDAGSTRTTAASDLGIRNLKTGE
jgi:hypothetical protein